VLHLLEGQTLKLLHDGGGTLELPWALGAVLEAGAYTRDRQLTMHSQKGDFKHSTWRKTNVTISNALSISTPNVLVVLPSLALTPLKCVTFVTQSPKHPRVLYKSGVWRG